jgi:hypothetical protein
MARAQGKGSRAELVESVYPPRVYFGDLQIALYCFEQDLPVREDTQVDRFLLHSFPQLGKAAPGRQSDARNAGIGQVPFQITREEAIQINRLIPSGEELDAVSHCAPLDRAARARSRGDLSYRLAVPGDHDSFTVLETGHTSSAMINRYARKYNLA